MHAEIDQALQVLVRSRPHRAIELRNRIEAGGADSGTLCELASELAAQQQADPAATMFMAAMLADPDCVAAHKGLGLLLESAGFLADAADSFASALRLQSSSEHHYLLARALHQSGERSRSTDHYEAALRLDQDNVDAWYNLAILYGETERVEQAIKALLEVTRRQPEIARAWTSLGALQSQQGKDEQAVDSLSRAVQLEPRNVLAHANLADALRMQDRIEEARKQVDRALLLEPASALACSIAARLDLHDGQPEAARDRLELRLEAGDCGILEGRILVDLAMAYDRLGNYAQAFEANAQGQGLLAQQPPASSFNPTTYPSLVAALEQWTARRSRAPSQPLSDGPTPNFLIGFPRSGTTLTEQILSAHPALTSLDEIPLIEQLSQAATQLTGLTYPDCIDALQQRDIETLREQYWQLLEQQQQLDRHQPLLDKLPLNMVHIGLIERVFPEARLVVALRDPRDCCLSAFMQDFVPNPAMIQFMSMERTTALYQQVMGLWLKNRASLRCPWLETRYEDLVDDLEGTARRLLSFLELPFDSAVLEYHRHAAAKRISTPSHQDVTKPIFRRALARWRRYEEQFAPFQEGLAPFVEAFGYRS